MTPVTPVEDLTVVRARLKRMVDVAKASSGWGWYADLPVTGNADDAFIAAASPDLLLRVAREALGVLNRHSNTNSGDCRWCGNSWPCADFDGVLRAWQP